MQNLQSPVINDWYSRRPIWENKILSKHLKVIEINILVLNTLQNLGIRPNLYTLHNIDVSAFSPQPQQPIIKDVACDKISTPE